MVLIVVAGLAIGAWLAVRTRPSQEARQRVTVETSVRTPGPEPTVAPTPSPIATPASTPVAVPTTAPRAVVTEATASSSLQGSWQFDEANVQVGTILWVGSAAMDGSNSVVFDVHKQSVGGRLATRCERATGLHATLSVGVGDQTVPYREVNCQGVVSTGEVRITGFAANRGHFSGSFWSNGANLGHFDARKL
ncbi:MAG: hypothetical protein M3N49_08795 [Candidatus Eremiobacteraeota bacterium]|nr:hypothetical protein [Candidatus Eremiobacteraeota bacterium]